MGRIGNRTNLYAKYSRFDYSFYFIDYLTESKECNVKVGRRKIKMNGFMPFLRGLARRETQIGWSRI